MEFVVTSINIDCLSVNREYSYLWENRKYRLGDYLNHSLTDVICFQEACDINIDYINSIQNNLLYFKGYGIKNSEGIMTYNPIYWKDELFDKLKDESFYLKDTEDLTIEPGWDSSELRSVSWVLLKNKYDNSRFIILNTHFDNKGVIARFESAKLITNFVKELSSQECCPAIITGDFNSRPWYPPHEDQRSYGDLIWAGYLPTDTCHRVFEESGFIDSYYLSGKEDSLDSNTYHDYHGGSFPKVGLRIDWQLIWKQGYPNIELCSYNVESDFMISDHFPVSCKYLINSTIFDCLYSGYNKVFTFCSQGYALKNIGCYLDNKYDDKEFIKNAVQEENYLKYTLGEQREGFDFPSNNAVYQGGVIEEFDCSGEHFIVKKNNPQKKRLSREIDNYKKLKCLFPDKYLLGTIDEKKVFFDIVAPININRFNIDGYSLMHKLDGETLDSLIYDYCDIDIRLLEYFVKIINILFQKGFVCVDISPRNVIIYQTQNEVCYQLIDFEKSYFLPVDEIERKKSKLMRGQFCGEELAVLLDMKTIKQLFGADYDPDNWDITDSNILYEPYRPEVHDILIGRKMNTYTVGIYNQVEKEVHNVVKPNRNAKYEVARYPGRIKFKVEHYFNCLSIGDGGDYERKVTELLIRAYDQSYINYNRLVKYLADQIGLVEEQVLLDYSILGEITEAKQQAIELRDLIDRIYSSIDEMNAIIGEIRC